MYGIPNSERFARVEPLNKGWSNDRKFYIETVDRQKLLLRVADMAEYERKKAEYGMLERVARLGVPMTRPVEFGICDGGKSAYLLLTWCEGEDAEAALPRLPESEHYALGKKAGQLLKVLHALPAPEDAEPWAERFRRKRADRAAYYRQLLTPSEGCERILRFLEARQDLLEGRPQCFNHGDYNLSNLIVMPNQAVGVIDFNAYNACYGDPWWEFSSIAWGERVHPRFCTGAIQGYFEGPPPEAFFQLLVYYYAYSALAAVCEAHEMEAETHQEGLDHVQNVLTWFDGLQNPVPTWYLPESAALS